MSELRNGTMGRVAAEIELANNVDRMMAELGMLAPDKVRRIKLTGIIDTGTTRMVLPTSAVSQLGLVPTETTTVKYADQRRVERPLVYNVWLTLQGRSGHFSAIVEPDRTDALAGAIPMEEMDFLVNCSNNRVIPRDPSTTISEVE